MKRLFTFVALFCIVLCGCSQNKKQQTMTNDQKKETKVLVTYFSASGVTRGVAEKIAKAANADIAEIVPEKRYTDADLNWQDKNSRSSVEMKDKSSRPAIKKNISNIGDYETIYIGFPIWWYTAPTIINTFIESYDLSGKNIVLFATSGGSGIDRAARDLKASYPNLNFIKSALLNSPSDDEVKNFIK